METCTLPLVQETEHVAHVRLGEPLTIKIDGMKKEAVVMMPEELKETEKAEEEKEVNTDREGLPQE